jgi:hypothetical protein
MKQWGVVIVVVAVVIEAAWAGPDTHKPEAELARAQAIEAARAGGWTAALAAATKAIAAEPKWAELYFVRAGIHVGAAGPDSDAKKLRLFSRAADYALIKRELSSAVEDWKQYLKLSPNDRRKDSILEAIGTYSALAGLAGTHATFGAQLVALEAAYREGKAAKCIAGRVLVDGLHCCWQGQTWDKNERRCEGACPSGYRDHYGTCLPPVGRTKIGACDSRTVYLYAPKHMDEEVMRLVDQAHNSGSDPFRDIVGNTPISDKCISRSENGEWCCP